MVIPYLKYLANVGIYSIIIKDIGSFHKIKITWQDEFIHIKYLLLMKNIA